MNKPDRLISSSMTDEEKIALHEKLCESDKYEEVYSVSTSGRKRR